MRDDADTAVIRRAQLIIYQASWHLMEEAALASLADTHGLRRAPLDPRSDVIQLVTYDGQHLGHIRKVTTAGRRETWVAIRKPGGTTGLYPTARTAAEALAVACGKRVRRHG